MHFNRLEWNGVEGNSDEHIAAQIKCQVEKPKAGNQPKQYTMPDKYSKCWQKD